MPTTTNNPIDARAFEPAIHEAWSNRVRDLLHPQVRRRIEDVPAAAVVTSSRDARLHLVSPLEAAQRRFAERRAAMVAAAYRQQPQPAPESAASSASELDQQQTSHFEALQLQLQQQQQQQQQIQQRQFVEEQRRLDQEQQRRQEEMRLLAAEQQQHPAARGKQSSGGMTALESLARSPLSPRAIQNPMLVAASMDELSPLTDDGRGATRAPKQQQRLSQTSAPSPLSKTQTFRGDASAGAKITAPRAAVPAAAASPAKGTPRQQQRHAAPAALGASAAGSSRSNSNGNSEAVAAMGRQVQRQLEHLIGADPSPRRTNAVLDQISSLLDLAAGEHESLSRTPPEADSPPMPEAASTPPPAPSRSVQKPQQQHAAQSQANAQRRQPGASPPSRSPRVASASSPVERAPPLTGTAASARRPVSANSRAPRLPRVATLTGSRTQATPVSSAASSSRRPPLAAAGSSSAAEQPAPQSNADPQQQQQRQQQQQQQQGPRPYTQEEIEWLRRYAADYPVEYSAWYYQTFGIPAMYQQQAPSQHHHHHNAATTPASRIPGQSPTAMNLLGTPSQRSQHHPHHHDAAAAPHNNDESMLGEDDDDGVNNNNNNAEQDDAFDPRHVQRQVDALKYHGGSHHHLPHQQHQQQQATAHAQQRKPAVPSAARGSIRKLRDATPAHAFSQMQYSSTARARPPVHGAAAAAAAHAVQHHDASDPLLRAKSPADRLREVRESLANLAASSSASQLRRQSGSSVNGDYPAPPVRRDHPPPLSAANIRAHQQEQSTMTPSPLAPGGATNDSSRRSVATGSQLHHHRTPSEIAFDLLQAEEQRRRVAAGYISRSVPRR